MQARNVLELVAVLVGENQLVQSGIFSENGNIKKLLDKDYNKVELLLKCLNAVLHEVCTDYCNISLIGTYSIKNNTFCISDLVEYCKCPILKINYIVINDKEVSFEVDGDKVTIEGSYGDDVDAFICFNTIVDVHRLRDNLFDLMSANITERILAYGVAATYKANGNNEDGLALYWERLYCDALEDITGIRAGVLNPHKRRLVGIGKLVD